MIAESAIWGGSRIGDYLVQADRLFRVQIMPGRMIRAWPEPQVHPLPVWAGQWTDGARHVALNERWILIAEVHGTPVPVDQGIVQSIEAVELSLEGPITKASPPGRYEIRTFSELVVVLVGKNSFRAAHARLLNGLGSGYEGDGRMRDIDGDFLLYRGDRGTLAWNASTELEEDAGFTTAEIYRITWQAPRLHKLLSGRPSS